jgi:hypothetical protein
MEVDGDAPSPEESTMKMTFPARLGLIIFLLASLWVLWYCQAGDFRDSAVSGTYTIQLSGVASTLTLRSDHSFRQEVDSAGQVSRTNGSWRVLGLGTIEFSKDFQKLPGQEEHADGTAYGYLANWFGVRSLTLAPESGGPRLHKKWFH